MENSNGGDTNVESIGNSIKNERSSIEETIKIIERKIKEAEHYTDITGFYLTLDKELCNAFINILSDYKRVLKENEELKKTKITYEKVRDIQEKNKNIVDNNYIPKQKIKDKIEEINKMIAYEHNDAVIIQLGKQKRVLQKLLESEE